MKLQYTVNNEDYFTVKQILKEEFNMSDRLILKLKNAQNIRLNNESTYINKNVNINDIIDISIDFVEDNSNIVPTKMDLDILFEDDAMLIVNKPAGVAVHPSMLHFDNSLSNGVKFYFDEIGLRKKYALLIGWIKIHLGIVIFAKNEYIQECLVKQMNNHIFKKNYIAVVNGLFDQKRGIIDAPIARKENSIIERCVNTDGDTAITEYYVIKEFNNMSLVFVSLQTGRTHQIRVHMAYLGHFIVGDTLYGNASNLIARQALHACKVRFIHPITKEFMNIEADLPEDIAKVIL